MLVFLRRILERCHQQGFGFALLNELSYLPCSVTQYHNFYFRVPTSTVACYCHLLPRVCSWKFWESKNKLNDKKKINLPIHPQYLRPIFMGGTVLYLRTKTAIWYNSCSNSKLKTTVWDLGFQKKKKQYNIIILWKVAKIWCKTAGGICLSLFQQQTSNRCAITSKTSYVVRTYG